MTANEQTSNTLNIFTSFSQHQCGNSEGEEGESGNEHELRMSPVSSPMHNRGASSRSVSVTGPSMKKKCLFVFCVGRGGDGSNKV
jgi:hypothetical protein